ncbi:MAG: hypothetical protein C4547_10395 [Phycisphaerales bacterium]|nr:MAG: hypothetical protein C4547_10395 [Phycisphaerales bacterium]
MGKKSFKNAALALLCGGMLLGSGCLGNWQQWLIAGALQQGFEFLLDNDSVFDLWEDGNVAE